MQRRVVELKVGLIEGKSDFLEDAKIWLKPKDFDEVTEERAETSHVCGWPECTNVASKFDKDSTSICGEELTFFIITKIAYE